MVYICEFHLSKTRERHFTILIAIQKMATVVQTLFAILILTQDFAIPIGDWFIYRPWRLYVIAGNIMSILSVIGLLFLPESPMFDFAMGRPSLAMKTLQLIYTQNTRNSLNVGAQIF